MRRQRSLPPEPSAWDLNSLPSVRDVVDLEVLRSVSDVVDLDALPSMSDALSSLPSVDRITTIVTTSIGSPWSAQGEVASAQILVALFLGPALLALLFSSYSRRGKAQEGPASDSSGLPNGAATAAGAGSKKAAAVTTEWWHSPLASPAEARVIADAKALVLRQEGLATKQTPLPQHVDLELLRQLRALGPKTADHALAEVYGNHLRWRREHVLRPRASLDFSTEPRRLWYASEEHAHGDWAKTRVDLGLCLGRATGGHAVKLERVGKARIGEITAEPGGPTRLLEHYYSLLDTMMVALNAESVSQGRLLRMYEVFDLKGLSIWQCTVVAIRTITTLLTVVTSVYAETTAKAVLINLPRAVAVPVRSILSLLPERVARRVLVIGDGEAYDFSNELDADAIRMLQSTALTTHVGTQLTGSLASHDEHWPGRPYLPEGAAAEDASSSSSSSSSSSAKGAAKPCECDSTVAAASTVRMAIARATHQGRAAGTFTAFSFGTNYNHYYGGEEADEDGVIMTSEVGKLCTKWKELLQDLFRR